MFPMSKAGKTRGLVVLAGAGSGDAALATVETQNWLRRADVVVYDRLTSPRLLDLCPIAAERIYVGKDPAADSARQGDINAVLIEHCQAGKLVVRLKGGDPLVFGRGGEEAAELPLAGCEFRIVPGISAAIAVGAYAGIPLTDRAAASSAALVTGHEDPAKNALSINWQALAGIDTVVFYMGVGNLPQIAQSLIAAGRSGETPAAVVENAASPRQRVIAATLETLPAAASEAAIRPPALIIVGHVVSLRDTLNWYERLPLFGQRVLVTRTRQQASALSQRLVELGAEVIEAPTIAVEPPESFAAVDAAIARLHEFDWLVLTSPNGVAALMDRIFDLGLDARRLAGVKIAAVGKTTAEALLERGLRADLVPDDYTTAALGKALVAAGSGGKMLLARADIATAELTTILGGAGAAVTELTVYRNVRPPSLSPEAVTALAQKRLDWITFTSSSTAENFFALAGDADLSNTKLASIGPVTSDTLRRHARQPTTEARPHTIEGLVEAMVQRACKQTSPPAR